jgi:exopolysaccharide biosynthesis WecB/TagA/CpsF family protein
MNDIHAVHLSGTARRSRFGFNRDAVSMSHDLMLVLDISGLLLAAAISTAVSAHWLVALGFIPDPGHRLMAVTVVVAAMALPLLHDPRFGRSASSGRVAALLRPHAMRLMLLTGLILALGTLGDVLTDFTRFWLLLWFVISMALTSLTRAAWVRYLRHLENDGRIGEVVAIVGHGEEADRLARMLGNPQRSTTELLGIFDDDGVAPESGPTASAFSIDRLLELGKTRRLDWILVAQPAGMEYRLPVLLRRLKALSAPVGICLPHAQTDLPYRGMEYVGGVIPISLLTERRTVRQDKSAGNGETFVPRWLITLALLPFRAVMALVARGPASPIRPATLTLSLDSHDVESFTYVAARFGRSRFGYVVTPNVDHVIRLHESAEFRSLYANASHTLLDSHFLSNVLRVTRRMALPVCPGSDLTANLFANVISPDDPLVLIGGSADQAQRLAGRFGLTNLAHFNPPMGFIRDDSAIQDCLRFIEAHSPFRFCLLAVGSPQQELLAQQLKQRGVARGLALCVGASVNFLIGDESRAPRWMQRCGMEWSYRLAQAPARMARRYLVRGPRIFALLRTITVTLRPDSAPHRQVLSGPTWAAGDPDRRSRTGRPPTLFQKVSTPGRSSGWSPRAWHAVPPHGGADAAAAVQGGQAKR